MKNYKKLTGKNKNGSNKTIILFDHDGTLCQTNPNSYDSIIYAAKDAAIFFKVPSIYLDVDWDSLFSLTRGTTELNLIHEIAKLYTIKEADLETFTRAFIKARANWYKATRLTGDTIHDTYHSDSLQVLDLIAQSPKHKSLLVTGNPKDVIEIRLSKHVRKYFTERNNFLGAFGEEAKTREEIIKIAIEKSIEQFTGFSPLYSEDGYIINVIYIGDSSHDMIAGLMSKVQVILIPSRDLAQKIDYIADAYNRFLAKTFEKHLLITNNLTNEDSLKFLGLEDSE